MLIDGIVYSWLKWLRLQGILDFDWYNSTNKAKGIWILLISCAMWNLIFQKRIFLAKLLFIDPCFLRLFSSAVTVTSSNTCSQAVDFATVATHLLKALPSLQSSNMGSIESMSLYWICIIPACSYFSWCNLHTYLRFQKGKNCKHFLNYIVSWLHFLQLLQCLRMKWSLMMYTQKKFWIRVWSNR